MRSFADKEVLITGGTGSLGKTLVKVLVKGEFGAPHGIRIFSRDEFKQNLMRQEMIRWFQSSPPGSERVPIAYLIGDVRDRPRVFRAMENVDVVIHTAAMKQVPACEFNPIEAVQTNIHGTENVLNAALERKVESAMLVSTDKAVHPANLYGATKMAAEKLFIHGNVYAGRKRTRFACCRYGNVLGSRGSIVPLFRDQAARGVPITLTHPDMSRFCITLPQAAKFVLKMTLRMNGGEVFVPIMSSAKVADIAEWLAPGHPMKETGVRAGEKIHECLISPEEPVLAWRDYANDFHFYELYSFGGKTDLPQYSNRHEGGRLTKYSFEKMLRRAEEL